MSADFGLAINPAILVSDLPKQKTAGISQRFFKERIFVLTIGFGSILVFLRFGFSFGLDMVKVYRSQIYS